MSGKGYVTEQKSCEEGDRVNAGDVLIVLDDSQARAEYNVLWQHFYDNRHFLRAEPEDFAHVVVAHVAFA